MNLSGKTLLYLSDKCYSWITVQYVLVYFKIEYNNKNRNCSFETGEVNVVSTKTPLQRCYTKHTILVIHIKLVLSASFCMEWGCNCSPTITICLILTRFYGCCKKKLKKNGPCIVWEVRWWAITSYMDVILIFSVSSTWAWRVGLSNRVISWLQVGYNRIM